MSYIRNSNFFHINLQNPENINEIKLFMKNIEKNELEQLDKMTSISEIRTNLENLKKTVYNIMKENEQTDSLKVKIIDIEEKINAVKKEILSELKTLIKSEYNSLKDLQFLEKKIDDFGSDKKTQDIKRVTHSACRVQSSNADNPSVKFQKFLSIYGGHTGGWPEQDHILFIKERKKNKERNKFISSILSLLPSLCYNDVIEHENWYVNYVALQNNVKEAIKNWKANKILKENMQHKTNLEEKNVTSNNKLTYHRNVAEKIKQWKQQQFYKKLEEYEKQKEEEQKVKAEEQKLKKAQMLKKLALNQYKIDKLKKMQTNIFQLEKNQTLESKQLKNDMLKYFRLQDIKFMEKKKIIQLQLESKNKRIKKLRVPNPTIDLLLKRDPHRVQKPTLTWNLHCQTNEQTNTLITCDINSISRLAIPDWRKDLKWK